MEMFSLSMSELFLSNEVPLKKSGKKKKEKGINMKINAAGGDGLTSLTIILAYNYDLR